MFKSAAAPDRIMPGMDMHIRSRHLRVSVAVLFLAAALALMGRPLPAGAAPAAVQAEVANDQVHGGPSSDKAMLGAGNDLFWWDPGDDSDLVEGQSGSDRLQFNGSSSGEWTWLGPAFEDGGGAIPRLRIYRDVGFVGMDV